MKIIILGYTGLIGSSVLRRLAKNKSFNLICVGRTDDKILTKNKKIQYLKWDFKTFENSKVYFLRKGNIVINCIGKSNNNSKNLKYINTLFVKKLTDHINKNKYKIRLIHLSSVSVYGQNLSFNKKYKIFTENEKLRSSNMYSKSKIKAEKFIKYASYRNLNNNYSFTILRISNVFGTKEKTNLFKFVAASFKIGFWIKCSENIMFNFVHVKDVAQAIYQVVLKLKVSKNKTYNVANDFTQKQIYKNYEKLFKKKLIEIDISIKILKFFYHFFPIPNKILNLFLLISSQVNYSNNKIKKELSFRPKYCIKNFIKIINE